MSELDKSLRELRDDLRSVITPPELDRVVGRARQRSVRRRMQIGAIAAVVAVSVAVPALRIVPESPPPGGPSEPPVTYEVDFADPGHGYALGRDCGRRDQQCQFTLLATTDGGRTWQPRRVPGDTEFFRSGDLFVLGRERLEFYRYSVTHDEVTKHESFTSKDGGETWDRYETWSNYDTLPVAEPTRIPDGALLQRICTPDVKGPEESACVSIGSADEGTITPVIAQPPLVTPVLGAVATAGGRHWAIGADRATGRWAIAVTSDGGATWTTNPLDVPDTPYWRNPWSVVEHDGTLYATVVGSEGMNPIELLAVFRSTDGGRSWTRTYQATDRTHLLNVYGDAVATTDGRLLVYSTTEGTLESRDGRTFRKAERQLAGPVKWTRAGYVAARDENTYEISRDGLDWRRFTLRAG